MNCQYCKEDNKDGWFYCRICGKRAHESNFTTNMWMMSDIGKRTDIEFSSSSMADSIEDSRQHKMNKNRKFWKDKLKKI